MYGLIFFFLLLPLIFLNADSPEKVWKLNTSNLGKFEEFKKFFFQHGAQLVATHVDLNEVDADPLTVVVQKASQMESCILVEDTSLDVEGAQVGVNVKWLLTHLKELVGRKATWTTLLAYRKGDQVYVFRGMITGKIVEARGEKGFGFDPVFLPDGSNKTLAEEKPDKLNARALAVDALLEGKPFAIKPLIEKWEGNWQQD